MVSRLFGLMSLALVCLVADTCSAASPIPLTARSLRKYDATQKLDQLYQGTTHPQTTNNFAELITMFAANQDKSYEIYPWILENDAYRVSIPLMKKTSILYAHVSSWVPAAWANDETLAFGYVEDYETGGARYNQKVICETYLTTAQNAGGDVDYHMGICIGINFDLSNDLNSWSQEDVDCAAAALDTALGFYETAIDDFEGQMDGFEGQLLASAFHTFYDHVQNENFELELNEAYWQFYGYF